MQTAANTRRIVALRALLQTARDRLKPEDVGLSNRGRRSCPGLRREEVAELAGISTLWYTRFERGERRVSTRVIERLCAALRLDKDESDRLVRLSLPELDSSNLVLRSTGGLSGVSLSRELKKIDAASTIDELCESALRLIAASIRADLFFADRAESDGSRAVAMSGYGASAFEGRIVSWQDDVILWQQATQRIFVCPDVSALNDGSDCAEVDAGYRSFIGAKMYDVAGNLCGAIGGVRRDTGNFTREEIATIDAIARLAAPRS